MNTVSLSAPVSRLRTSALRGVVALLVFGCGTSRAPLRINAPPGASATSRTIRAIRGSNSHACALFDSGRVACWGVNEHGALGDGTTADPASPLHAVWVDGLDGVAEVDVGDDFSCARKTDGTVWCWGDNQKGQLGRETLSSSPRPVQVPGVTGATDLALNLSLVAVARGANPVMVWGHGRMTREFGGDASTDRNFIPLTTTLRSGSRVAWVSFGGLCASDETGPPRCIGAFRFRGVDHPIALRDPIGDRFSFGEEHCCYLYGGEARCVGPSPNRDLWDPVGNGPARDVRTTWRGTQIIDSDGVYRCFGECPDLVLSPTRTYRQVTAGAILADDSTVWAWGPLIQGMSGPHPILRFGSAAHGEPQPVVFPR